MLYCDVRREPRSRYGTRINRDYRRILLRVQFEKIHFKNFQYNNTTFYIPYIQNLKYYY